MGERRGKKGRSGIDVDARRRELWDHLGERWCDSVLGIIYYYVFNDTVIYINNSPYSVIVAGIDKKP